MRRAGAAEWGDLQRAEPYLRWGVTPGDPDPAGALDVWLPGDDPVAERGSGLVAISRRRRSGGRTVHVVQRSDAPPGTGVAALARLVGELVPLLGVAGLTVPRALAEPLARLLPELLPRHTATPPEGIGWDWMWTTSRVPTPAQHRAVDAIAASRLTPVPLDATDPPVAAEIQALLDAESPRHSAEPGDQHVRQWFGLRAGSELVACAAWYESVPGVPLLASVAVRSGYRRRGLGVVLMVMVTDAAFDAGAEVVTVDLYADNPAARSLYRELEFRLEQEFASWWLEPRMAV